MYYVPHIINGEKIKKESPRLDIYNPALGKPIGQVGVADKILVDLAVNAACNAYPEWANTPPLKRSRILFKFKRLLEEHIDELAKIITEEHGKTLADAKSSIQRGIDVVEFVCGIPAHLKGIYTENISPDIDCYSIPQPLGVCVGITPFNFPAMIPLWMFPMAIACGNTFILKPSEKDPSCAIRLIELASKAGVPNGVLNVLQGDHHTVEHLITHKNVKAISFVGSTLVAEKVFQRATSCGKRVQAFAGAKNHAVVMPDADLNQAVNAIMGAAFGSAGERCMAISVVIAVGDRIGDQLIEKLKPKIKALKVGFGLNPDTDMGPLITKEHWNKVKAYVDLGVDEGAKLIVDGRIQNEMPGFYFGGTLFDQVLPNMRIYQEEIFGPVLSLVRVANLATALKYINEHPYGNGTAIFTSDGETARTFSSQVEVGMVGINIPIPVPVPYHSFGGWKRSMFGDIPMHGTEGIRFFTRLKTITARWIKHLKVTEFAMPQT